MSGENPCTCTCTYMYTVKEESYMYMYMYRERELDVDIQIRSYNTFTETRVIQICFCSQILTVGKSINFLRLRCRDHTELFSSEEKTWFMKETGQNKMYMYIYI